MKDEILVKSKSLLTHAQRIFGDIVQEAFVVYQKDDSGFGIMAERDWTMAWGTRTEAIHYDTLTIQLRFTNGNLVRFEASEWASIRPVKE